MRRRSARASFVSSATASARGSGCSISAGSPCDRATMAAPARSSSSRSRSPGASDIRNWKANARKASAISRCAPGTCADAEARFARALRICRDAEDKRGEAIAVWSLGRVDAANGYHEAARRKFADALPAFQSFGMNSEALDCVEDCAALLCAADRPGDAVRLHAAAATVRGALALQSPGGAGARERNLEAARSALGQTAFEMAWSSGAAWTLEQTIEHALDSTTGSAVTA